MINLISSAIARVSAFLSNLQVKRFAAVCVMGFLLLTTNSGFFGGNNDSDNINGSNKALTKQVKDRAHQDGGQRPRTTGEWMKEKAEDAPVTERVKQITEDSAEAVKQWGKQYPSTAERSARELKENTGYQPNRS